MTQQGEQDRERGETPPPIYREIETAMRQGDALTAYTLARRALDAGLRHPVLFTLRAQWHEGAGRLIDAAGDLNQALALTPGDPRLLAALGRCLSGGGRFRPAAAAWAALVAADPGQANAYYNLAFAKEQLGELEDAWSAYTKAAEIDPTLDDAIARLAGLAARRTDHAEARALADRALALNPKSVTAAFAHIVSDLAEDRFAQAEQRARAIASDTSVVMQARAHALSVAGDALHGQGRYDEAFGFYTEANGVLRALFRAQYEAPGRETGEALARRLAKEFEAIPPPSWHVAPITDGGEAAGLAFLMGFPRAGTTLLGQVLSSHPRAVALEEKPVLRDALRDFIDSPGGLAHLAALTPQGTAHYRELFWRALRDLGVEARDKVVVDQTPLNTLHLPVIAKLFPEARIVFAQRDPRDVVLSCFRRLFAMNGYVYEFLSLDGAARFYDETMRLATRFREGLPLNAIDVRNEDVIADFDRETGALCAFLGLEWNEKMRRFADTAKAARIATPSAMQVARGLRNDGVGHWQYYADELAPVLPIVAPWVERFGYA